MVAEIIRELEAYEYDFGLRNRKRRSNDQATFEGTVEALIADAVHRELTHPGGRLTVPMSNKILGRKGGRYGAPFLSKVLPDVVGRLASPGLGWLDLRKGDWEASLRSSIQATPRLRERMAQDGLTVGDLTRSADGEAIILHSLKVSSGDKPEQLPYDDTPETRAYRDQMRIINTRLEDAEIDFDDSVADGVAVDVTARHMRRVFNGSFTAGGRLWRGFWQRLSKAHRLRGISIGGEPVVELDYGQMAARLAYGLAGAAPPVGDLYSVPGYEQYRAGWKELLNALFMTERLPTRYPKEVGRQFQKALKVDRAVELLQQHHPAIAPYFGAGMGLKLMFAESQVLVDVLLRCGAAGIVALPIHDAVLVPRSAAEATQAIMLEVFRDHVGVEGSVSITRPEDLREAG